MTPSSHAAPDARPLADALDTLEPRLVWRFFEGLTRVPRPSKHEEAIRRHAHDLARQQGWTSREDAAGNIVIEVPATAGYEQAPVVVLQGHLDMVAEKNRDVEHDFIRDSIRAVVTTEETAEAPTGLTIVRAQGTTLGADNGIGVALALAAASDPECVHGPLELLLTSDEEMGMTGANALQPDFIRGRLLINLDSEEDDAIYIGCAGGCDVTFRWALKCETIIESSAAKEVCRVTVGGLRGGHSGGDIHLNRANAIRLAARIVARAMDDGQNEAKASFPAGQPQTPMRLIHVEGGSKRNAIPREASIMISGPAGTEAALGLASDEVMREAKELHGEPAPEIETELVDFASITDAAALSIENTTQIIRTLSSIPTGVLTMVADIPGLVQTSNNLSTATTVTPTRDAEHSSAEVHRTITIGCLTRSSNWLDLISSVRMLVDLGRLGGADVTTGNAYPGWQPNVESALLARCRNRYAMLFNEEPKVLAIHAGLECGIIGRQVGGGIDMVSFGPNIKGAHSPDERVYVDSVKKSYRLLKTVLKDLATN